MRNIFEYLQAQLFEKILSGYTANLPKVFLTNETNIKKTSINFLLYKHSLDMQIETLKKFQQKPPEFIEKVQLIRLQKILKLAAKTSWWSNYFQKHAIDVGNIHTLTDLRAIPSINRNDIINTPKEEFLTVNADNPLVSWGRTSGSTTGTPLEWGSDKRSAIVGMVVNLLVKLEKHGFVFRENFDSNFCLIYNMFGPVNKHAFRWFAQSGFQILPSSEDRREKIKELNSIIKKTKDIIFFTGPNELILLVDYFKEAGLRPHIPYFITVGSPLHENARSIAAEYFHSQIFSYYGTKEAGQCGIECKDVTGAYHPRSDRAILELLDEDGQPVEEGTQGLVTITCLDNTVMPLVRYQTGDWGIFISSPLCNCGNRLPLFKILQRTTDVVYFSDGEKKSISPVLRSFNRPAYIYSVRRFQIEQDRLDHILVRLEIRQEQLPESAVEELHARIGRVFKEKLQAEIIQTSNITTPSGTKFKVFIPLKID